MGLSKQIKILKFADLGDERGNLVVVEGSGHDIPFEIKRVFYIYGSDAGVVRGRHANRKTEFVMINVSGQSKVKVSDGELKETQTANYFSGFCPIDCAVLPANT